MCYAAAIVLSIDWKRCKTASGLESLHTTKVSMLAAHILGIAQFPLINFGRSLSCQFVAGGSDESDIELLTTTDC